MRSGTRVTHVCPEIAPHLVFGGLGIAAGRMVEQIHRAGASSRVLTRSSASGCGPQRWGSLQGLPVREDESGPVASFITAALEALAHAPPDDHELLVVHESAALVPLARLQRVPGRLVYWLHSLYDTPLPSRLPSAWRPALDPESTLTSAVDSADLVVTSAGVLADADEVAWSGMAAIQAALLRARARGATRTLEAYQCLPDPLPDPSAASTMLSPPDRARVVFPSRPYVHKGIGFLLAIAERLADLDVEFVAIGDPAQAKIEPARAGLARVRWLPWQDPAQFQALLASATCVLVPSLSEGFGLAAAEAAAAGVPLVVHDVGGLRSLPASAADIVRLTPAERASLYSLWGSLRHTSAHWDRWDAAGPRLAGLIDRWTAQVEQLVRSPSGPRRPLPLGPARLGPLRLGPPDAPSWGQALLDWR